MFQQFKTRVFNFGVKMIKTALTEVESEKLKMKNDQVAQPTSIKDENKYSSENLSKDLQYSEREGEDMKDWWERAHVTQHKFWLTGSEGEEVWKYLKITDKLKVGAKVLNIGVGTGHCTHELKKIGLTVHALDISLTALDNVKDVAVCWTPDKLNKLPKNFFDIAISNLVVQHMNDKALLLQIKAVCRSLTPDGIFAIQFSQGVGHKLRFDQSLQTQKGGGVLRTNKEFIKLVEQAGGKILRLWNGPVFKKYSSRWVFAHIGKI